MILLMRFVVSGHSMEPSFKEGQTLLVSSIPYLFSQPKVGDVVIIKDPRDGRLLLKRIETIHTRHSGKRSQVPNGTWRSAFRIPLRFWASQNDNKYLVAGDNQKASTDSRTFGTIKKENILGKVILNLTSKVAPPR